MLLGADGWHDPSQKFRAQAAVRAGWLTFGIGAVVVVLGSTALAYWPASCDGYRCTRPAYPAFLTLGVVVLTSPIAMAAGGTVGTWALRYQTWHTRRIWSGREVRFAAGPGAFSLRF